VARNPRTANGSKYRRLRRQVLASDDRCCLCGGYVDRSLRSPHPMSATVEHLIPISKGGGVYAESNLGIAHRICNLRRGNRMPGAAATDGGAVDEPIMTSREW
jgi:5-methylcytosine-specific restriction endonuclease McrA